MLSVMIWFLLIMVIINYPIYLSYKKSSYKESSGNSFFKTRFDKGLYGEFLTYVKLEKLQGDIKLFTNVYVPKGDGSTTEIDLVMLDETGIYVFESKNYSGWIFGDEKYKTWTQTLQNKQKHKFFNPIWQNKGHINALKSVMGNDVQGLYKSYIIFSERCTLKKINVASSDVKVMKRDRLLSILKEERLSSPKVFSREDILLLENKIRPYCLVDEETKLAHVREIQNRVK